MTLGRPESAICAHETLLSVLTKHSSLTKPSPPSPDTLACEFHVPTLHNMFIRTTYLLRRSVMLRSSRGPLLSRLLLSRVVRAERGGRLSLADCSTVLRSSTEPEADLFFFVDEDLFVDDCCSEEEFFAAVLIFAAVDLLTNISRLSDEATILKVFVGVILAPSTSAGGPPATHDAPPRTGSGSAVGTVEISGRSCSVDEATTPPAPPYICISSSLKLMLVPLLARCAAAAFASSETEGRVENGSCTVSRPTGWFSTVKTDAAPADDRRPLADKRSRPLDGGTKFVDFFAGAETRPALFLSWFLEVFAKFFPVAVLEVSSNVARAFSKAVSSTDVLETGLVVFDESVPNFGVGEFSGSGLQERGSSTSLDEPPMWLCFEKTVIFLPGGIQWS